MIAKFEGQYFFLSNFFECPVTYKGITFTNTEAAFHSQKDINRAKEFAHLDPSSAKKLGRKVTLRSDWEQVKDEIMYEVLVAKFTQNAALKILLLRTGDQELIEGNWWNDTYWGVCRGVGRNTLGKLLMRLRQELREGKYGSTAN